MESFHRHIWVGIEGGQNMDVKISAGVWIYGMGSDRYVSQGYKKYIDFYERVEQISKIEGISGIEVTYPGDVNEENANRVRELLLKHKLTISSMGVELVCDKEWKNGSFSSKDEKDRIKAIELTKKAMDLAQIMNIPVVSLWLGQDGFDYVFESDYPNAWRNLVESLRDCADHNPKVKLGLEYKVSEPKLNCFVNSGGKALALCQAVGRDNLGVTLDVGHALNALENPAEIASILMYEKRLFHLHMNDNYGRCDDDMPSGSVHVPQFIELMYWLDKTGYKGWLSLDMYPYRDDPSEACKASVKFLDGVSRFVSEKINNSDLTCRNGRPISYALKELFEKMFD